MQIWEFSDNWEYRVMRGMTGLAKALIVHVLIAQSLPNVSVRHHIAQSLLKVKLQARIALNLPKKKLVLSQNLLNPPLGLQTYLTCPLVNAVKLLNTRS